MAEGLAPTCERRKHRTVISHHDNRPPAQQPTIYLDKQLLTLARKQRHLGTTFKHDLHWTEHNNAILNKSLTSMKNILRLRNSLNSSALAYLHCTYVRPKLEYACIALSPLPTHTMDKLERFQRKVAKVCLRLPLYTPADHSHMLRRLSLSSLHCRRNIKHLLFAHSIHHRFAPPHILQLNLPPPHLTTLFIIDDPTIYLAPVLTTTKTPLYIYMCVNLHL